MACPWRHHLGFGKPVCSIWMQLALYCRDINIPNSPKRGGNATVGCIACNQHYYNGTALQKKPIHGPCKVLLTSSYGPSTSTANRAERSHWRASSHFSSGMNQLLLSPPPRGWCAGPRFGRGRGSGLTAVSRGRHGAGTRTEMPAETPARMPVVSCGAPGPLRAHDPQHCKQSWTLRIFAHGWVFFWACERHIFSIFSATTTAKTLFPFN